MKFYLIIATSNKGVADELVSLNNWGKMKPLQAVHEFDVYGLDSHDEVPSWKTISWSTDQLKKAVIKHSGHDNFGEFEFLSPIMNPHQALEAAELYDTKHNRGDVLTTN
eukprot:scaffold73024_cov61-Attheya_sp.AAC.4